jgi:tetraacyldisaccharide 4'-kinase
MTPDFKGGARHLESLWWRQGSLGLAGLWLIPASLIYRAAWSLRALLFGLGLFKVHRAPVPVVVVGNVVVGGAGKTPCTIALVQALQSLGWTPGVITRGYAGSATLAQAVEPDNGAWPSAQVVGDEPLLLAKRLGVPVWIGARRIEAARGLCAAHPQVNVLVSDDGLQHAALHRDAQLIVFDHRGTGNGRMLPAGPLRQPWTAAPPARTAVVYGGAQASTPWPGAMVVRRLGPVVRFADWHAGRMELGQPLAEELMGPLTGTVDALAGIAAPEQFFAMLQAAGMHLRPHPRPDHVAAEDFQWPSGTNAIVITEKDAVKVDANDPITSRLWVATLDCELPQETLRSILAWLGVDRHTASGGSHVH